LNSGEHERARDKGIARAKSAAPQFGRVAECRVVRKIALEIEIQRPLGGVDAERLVREAEECFRCAKMPELRSEIAAGLETAGRELMSWAVEIETALQRAKRQR